jgi:hypothetical protein
LSILSPTELIAAIERNDLGALALFIPHPCLNFSSPAPSRCDKLSKQCGIECEIEGQCDCSVGMLECFQIKTILNHQIESF